MLFIAKIESWVGFGLLLGRRICMLARKENVCVNAGHGVERGVFGGLVRGVHT